MSSLAGDVSLKPIRQGALGYYDESFALPTSLDSQDSPPPPPEQWAGSFASSGAGVVTPSPSKMSLLSVDDAQLDELDEAVTILNDLHNKGVISQQEKQRRRALVISFMEFAAADYADEDGEFLGGPPSHVHSFGPALEIFRTVLTASVRLYRCCCPCLALVDKNEL